MIASESDPENNNENNMRRVKEAIETYFFQLTQGCGKENCANKNCASNPNFQKLTNNQAAALAISLAKNKAEICDMSNKLLKTPNNKSSQAVNSSKPEKEEDEDNFHFDDDDSDIVVSKNSSTVNLRASSAQSSKNLNDTLQDAIKYVSKISQTKTSETKSSEKEIYLSENRINNLIKKCKTNLSELKKQKMEVDEQDKSSFEEAKLNDKKDVIKSFKPLLSVLQKVYQDYKLLALSFRFKEENVQMSATMPSIPPFNIDFNSLRRSYSQLFSLESIIDEIEDSLDLSVYALCVSIRMKIKKPDLNEDEINQILHALLVVNELPILEDPRYMERCAKIFYSTICELSVESSAKIVKLWSNWHSDELKIFLNKTQQYITLEVISKNLDEENNQIEDEDEDENDNSNKKVLYKNEGITGAVNYLRLIYYASILGGRLDPAEQIRKEREMEQNELNYEEANQSMEENSLFSESLNSLKYFSDPLEKALNIRPIDCRESKIPLSDFINETANKYIDVQYDYVEYTKQMQYLEDISNEPASSNKFFKKSLFSFLFYPFFVVLTKKNLGLFYDNKLKMIRERRNNIMLSILEGRIPTPYFKIRLSRQNILAEALSLIELQEQENPAILRKQLFIEFENEQGIDQGGVSKEFFQLAIDELLNKGYTFFKLDEKTNYYWFTPCTLETEKEFKLVGILFGIAIYNNVLLDVQFPPVFFRKLLGKLGTFEDLVYSHPDLYQSFTSILEFQGSNEEFEETFMLNFQISLIDNFGATVNFNLKENGDKIPVNKENRQEFVELYADFVLNKGIEESFDAFRRGFLKLIVNSPLPRWYTPEELEILLCGIKVMDWKSLQDSTSYDSGFDQGQKYIKEFWEVFDEFTDEEKKLFLKFTTGTDRCPHGGLSELKLTLARNGPDTEKLPTAHTCFNILLLPEYSTKKKLKEKLLKAIQYSRGFGLS